MILSYTASLISADSSAEVERGLAVDPVGCAAAAATVLVVVGLGDALFIWIGSVRYCRNGSGTPMAAVWGTVS